VERGYNSNVGFYSFKVTRGSIKGKHFGFDEDEIFEMVEKIMLSLIMVRVHYGNHVSNSLINI